MYFNLSRTSSICYVNVIVDSFRESKLIVNAVVIHDVYEKKILLKVAGVNDFVSN